MKRVFEIHRKSNTSFNSFELSESVKINILQRKNITILSETYLPNILDYLREENLKEELKNDYVIVLMKEGKLISNIYKPKNDLFTKIQNDIYKEILPEIFESIKPNLIIKFKEKEKPKHIYINEYANFGFSNIWYIESFIVDSDKKYKLYSVNYNSNNCNNHICSLNDLESIINDYIRKYHKEYNLGPNAFVYLNDWTNEPKSIKLPLRFNTNSLLKILNNPKENSGNLESLDCNQKLEKYCIVPYIDLQNHIIYIVSTHNKVGMTNIENILKETMLVVCSPINYNITKDGWTLNLLRKIQESIDLELSDKKEDFKIELMF